MLRGSNPASARFCTPTRSASASWLRVKLICFCTCPACTARMAAGPMPGTATPKITAANVAAALGKDIWLAVSIARCKCCWVTWPISCAKTDANSLSDSVASMSPELMPILALGPAKALMRLSWTTKKLNAGQVAR